MELTAFFDKFINDEVNLNQTRIDTINEKTQIIGKYLKKNEVFKENFKEMIPQGSYAQKTIIKPPKDKDFDVDVLLFLKAFDGWTPENYIKNLYDQFSANDTYKKIIEINNRCVTINYKGDFHIDIVPFIQENGKYYIANKDTDEWEETNPMEYTEWLRKKNMSAKGYLVKSIRLFKYLRDVKQNYSVKSILLNTLIGNCVNNEEKNSDFKNLPTAFVALFERLNRFLKENKSVPTIVNPTLSSEDFNRHWDEEKYSNFCEKVKLYSEKSQAAYEETDKDKSVKKWREVFGEVFPEEIQTDSKTASLGILSSNSRPWGSC